MNKDVLMMFKYDCCVSFKCNKYMTIDILTHIRELWERQISTDKEYPGIYEDDIIEYEITKDNDIIILDIF